MTNIEKLLRDALEKKQNAANKEDTKMMAQELSREIASQMNIEELSGGVQKRITESILPIMAKLIERDQMSADTVSKAVRDAIKEIKIPETRIPDFPTIPTPRINIPAPVVSIPETVFPNEMDIKGWVQLMMNDTPVGMNNPLAVTLRNADGSPMNLLENLTTVVGGGGGGGPRIVKVSGVLSTVGVVTIDPDGKPVYSGSSSGLTDAELRAASVPVSQASGATWSTEVHGIFGSTSVDDVFNGDNRIRVSVEAGGSGLTDSELRASSVPVAQASGAAWSTEVTNTVTVDGSGVTQPVSAASLPLPSGAATSANQQTDALTDTELRAASVPVSQASGATWSTEVTNIPTVRPIQVRGSLATAYTSLSTGTETSLLAGVSSEYHDLVWVMGANQSDVAVTVDLRGSTGGNVIMSLEIPANATAGIAPAVPYPQADQDATWTVDMGDITGTIVDITALFSKEV